MQIRHPVTAAALKGRCSRHKDTTREERIRIVQEALHACGGACDFCNGCDNLGGGDADAFYQPYIDGQKEIAELNAEYRRGFVRADRRGPFVCARPTLPHRLKKEHCHD